MYKPSIRNFPKQPATPRSTWTEKMFDLENRAFSTRPDSARSCIEDHLAVLTRALDADEVARSRYVYLVMIEQALKPSAPKSIASIPPQAIEKALPQLAALKGYKSSIGLQDLMCSLLSLTASLPPLSHRHTAQTRTHVTASQAAPTHPVSGEFATPENSTYASTSAANSTEPEVQQSDDDAWADTQPNVPFQWNDSPIPMPSPPVNWGIIRPPHGMFW